MKKFRAARDGTAHARVVWLLMLGTAFLAGGCQDPVSTEAPSVKAVSPTASAAQNWERSSFFVDNVIFIDCLGENVRAFGEVLFQYHEVTTSSGNFSYHFQLRPATPNTPPFFVQGQTSGKLFRYKNGLPANESFHLGPGEVFTFVTLETYVAEDGDRLVGSLRVHLTVNANGELTVSRLEEGPLECVEK
jgi:hypothetical protein